MAKWVYDFGDGKAWGLPKDWSAHHSIPTPTHVEIGKRINLNIEMLILCFAASFFRPIFQADGRAQMKNLLGGKGANLAEMASIGLPVPPGFTLTTEICTHFYQNNCQYPKELEQQALVILVMMSSGLYVETCCN